MSDLIKLSLSDARQALRDKEITAVELTQAHIAHMEASRQLNAVVLETPERALEMAKASDQRIQNGTAGVLEGLPIGVKDLFCTKDVRTTACSNILGDFTPPYESTVTQQLWDAGAVMLGKLNNDEFAMN